MNVRPDGADRFESERSRLVGLAYRMLGSLGDAEDVVQEAWLRWDRADRESIERPAAWLTTVASRLAIDRLRQLRRRREDYVGPWLPEPAPTSIRAAEVEHGQERIVAAAPWHDGAATDPAADPAARVELDESLSMGFLVVLDQLGDVERVVFVLAEVFGEPYAVIADAVDRSPEACRQLASRARRRVRAARADRTDADEGLLAELVGAITLGDVDRVVQLLAPDVVLHSDGGPNRRAARRPVVGSDRVARLLVALATRAPEGPSVESIAFEEVNAAPALVVRAGAESMVLTAERELELEHGRVVAVRVMLNPDKLTGLTRSVELR